jgi:hypothetical protein
LHRLAEVSIRRCGFYRRRVSRLANESGHWNQLPGFECRVTSAAPAHLSLAKWTPCESQIMAELNATHVIASADRHQAGLECAALSSPSFTRLCFPRG